MKLYRMMKIDADGKPTVGNGSMMLGIRPTDPTQPERRFDVPAVNETDLVRPGDGGLSCYSDAAAIKLRSRKLALCSIGSEKLGSKLRPIATGNMHYLVEPTDEMMLGELQQFFAETRELWQLE